MHLHSHFGIYFPCFNCHFKLNTKCNCKGHVCATLLEGDGRFGPTIILASVRVRGCNAFIAIGVMGQNNSLIIIFFFWFFYYILYKTPPIPRLCTNQRPYNVQVSCTDGHGRPCNNRRPSPRPDAMAKSALWCEVDVLWRRFLAQKRVAFTLLMYNNMQNALDSVRSFRALPVRKETKELATVDDSPPAPMWWPNLHCGVRRSIFFA